jgi:hypothetical protein
MRLMMVVMVSTRSRKLCSEFKSELAFLGIGSQTVVVIIVMAVVVMCMMVRTAALENLLFFAVFALAAVAPDVVALELTGLVADGEGARWLHWSVAGRVWVVIVAIVFIVGESDEASALCVAANNGTQGWRWGAFAGARARAGEVKVRHCLGACVGVG